MATPNYGYEKRQKELAKKRKKEDKLKSKNERKVGGDLDGGTSEPSQWTDEGAGTPGLYTDPLAPSGS